MKTFIQNEQEQRAFPILHPWALTPQMGSPLLLLVLEGFDG